MPLPGSERMEVFIKKYGVSESNAEILIRNNQLAEYFDKAAQLGSTQNLEPKDILNWIINKKVELDSTTIDELIAQIVASRSVSGISDEELQGILQKILIDHAQVASDYKAGKINAIMFLIGQAMKELKGKAKADTVKKELEKLLQ